ncbi:IS4 family transposase [bacterium]|nr:IS4 family transposase [bacterium]
MHSNTCAKLLEFLRKFITSDDFIKQNRQRPTDFIRQRKLPFSTLVFFLINLIKGSYQDELNHFFKAIFGFDVAKCFVSKAALAKARMKLKYEAFIELNFQLVDYFYRNFKPLRWNDFTLLAIDGTTVQLPRIAAISEHFGVWKTKQKGECPMARVSQMFDPLNKITVDAIIESKDFGERELAAFHLLKLMPKDLILLDRGYPAYWLFNLILSTGANFCARIQRNRWKTVRQFYNSGKKEKIISLPAFSSSIKYCKDMGLDLKPLKLRLIRVELDTGEIEILITSLLDNEAYSHDQFADLYHLRWPVEEDYKIMKQWIEIENFSGKSVLSVYQDFHAKVFSKNLTSALIFQTQTIIDNNTRENRYRYKPNFTQALSNIKDVIPLLFIRSKSKVIEIISDLHAIIIRTIEPIRPGRKYPRNFNNRSGRFHYCYQPVR